jgi:transcriptional regulator with XRE-family HTH domain
MSIAHGSPRPELAFDLADRMRKALRTSDLSVQQIAERLEVSRNTVSAWINGRNKPRRRDLRDFALGTGVPLAWLETGEPGPSDDDPGLQSRLSESNRRPSHYKSVTSLARVVVLERAA